MDHEAGHRPFFSNQTFEDEEIMGYEGLRIDVALPTDTFVPLLFHSFTRKSFPANDYVSLLRKEFPGGLATTLDAFTAASVRPRPHRLAPPLPRPPLLTRSDTTQKDAAPLAEALADPCLHKVHAGTCKDGAAVHVLRGNVVAAGAALKALHTRMHPLVRFYIDGASELEQDDPRMDLLLAVRMEGDAPVAVMGLLTFYTCGATSASPTCLQPQAR